MSIENAPYNKDLDKPSVTIPQFKINNNISLDKLLREVQQDTFQKINCVKIGTIQSFDANTQTASIQISFLITLYTDYSGNSTYANYPVLLTCPCYAMTGGQSYITMPITAGDQCLVLFNDRDIDSWFYFGTNQPTNTNRMHDISDGFALVGFRNNTNFIQDYLETGIEIHRDNDTFIKLTENLIASNSINFQHTGNMHVIGDLSVTGNITCTGEITAGFGGVTPIALLTHKHSDVTNGPNNTGGPVS